MRARGRAWVYPSRTALLKTPHLSVGLTSSPPPGYPGLNRYRYVSLISAVHNGVHSIDHRFLQPGLHVCRLLCFAFNDHLIVAHENRHGVRTLVSTLPQEGQCQLQAVGSGALDRRVEAVGQPLDIHAAPSGERPGLRVATEPSLSLPLMPSPQTGVGFEEAPAVAGGFCQAHLHSVAPQSVGLETLRSHPVEQPEVDRLG